MERVGTALSRLFEGKEQFDLTRFLRDLPLALAQLAAAETARKGAPAAAAPSADVKSEPATTEPAATQLAPATTPEVAPAGSSPAAETQSPATAAEATSSEATPSTESSTAQSALSEPKPQSTNGGAPAEVPSPRLELRGRLLAAAPQLTKAVLTYRRTVTTVRRAAAPRRAPGPWRSDREVLEEARLAVDFARQMFDAYAAAWADQPTQPGIADSMSAETDRFLAWTQLARYMDVAAPRSQPPPIEKPVEKPPESAGEKQPVTQGSAGAGGAPAEGEPAHG